MHAVPAKMFRRAGLAATAACLLTVPLHAQTQPGQRDFRSGIRTGVGYSGVMPDAMLGLGAFHFLADLPVGIFADFKTTSFSGTASNDGYCPAGIDVCTNSWVLAERNDQHIEQTSEWLIVDAGIVYSLTPEFALLLGGGLARETRFQEYFDDNEDGAQRVTDSGAYFVDDDVGPSWKAQGVGGFLLRAGRTLAFRLSYETAIGGLGLGAYYRLR